MPKEHRFSVSVFIKIICYEKKILTDAQIDTGTKISLGKEFLL